MEIVFRENPEGGTYDLTIDGRAAEYDVRASDFAEALRRRRLDRSSSPIHVEDKSGLRTTLGRR